MAFDFYPLFSVHGNADDHGLIDMVSSWLAFFEGMAGGNGGDFWLVILPGLLALKNIHPVLVHFPIAFFSAFFVLDTAGVIARKPAWRSNAGLMLYAGTITALPTVLAGWYAANTVGHSEEVHIIMERHEYLAFSVFFLAFILTAWRIWAGNMLRGVANGFFMALSALLITVLTFTADLGGYMVYRFGVAVQAEGVSESGHHHDHGDGPEQQDHDHMH
ncbi:MAG: hypothetical protein CTY18_03410 [Methylomonas sp.]|nr:MAG: hypothetical protein CTY24_07115 [Methylobacter sp.]PPD36844.1 MAG: hypothetical protein CTY18_03410 [Methylomonas sp.]